ncbi:eukaryotic translation initiation factor 6-like isoform X2 [Zophobas morio]|uniref:eukaryotic translation initiation factor 6-like isoform X2 n=1 Tax=Zophobas morio TaxID=2755281 RepID=UPI0030831695
METTEQSMPSDIIPTRNYTSASEKSLWWYIKRTNKDYYGVGNGKSRYDGVWPQAFRTRRSYSGFTTRGYEQREMWTQALRITLGNNNDIGALVLINVRTVQGDLPDIPVIRTSLSGCRVIGRMCVGNNHGLLVPEAIYDTELDHIRDKIPEPIQIKKIEERLSALGNVVVCNDQVALVHPELDKESEEMIEDTLQVEVFRHVIANNPLVGSYCVLNNNGGLVHVDISQTDLEDLSSLLGLPLIPGTVNYGNKAVAAGVAANDTIAYAGMKTTSREFLAIEEAFRLPGRG